MSLPFKFLKCACVRINNSEHDMMSKFFYQNYEGEPLPKSFEHVLIETNRNGIAVSIACTHEEEKICIDCYIKGVWVCNVELCNTKLSKGSDGHFEVRPNVKVDREIFTELAKQFNGNAKAANDEFKGLSVFCVEVAREILFIFGSMPEIFFSKVEEVKMSQKPNEKKKGKKNGNKRIEHKVYTLNSEELRKNDLKDVIKKVVDTTSGVSTTNAETTTCSKEAKAEKKPTVYKTLTWKRKAYTCIRNGKEVHYKECICTRRIKV